MRFLLYLNTERYQVDGWSMNLENNFCYRKNFQKNECHFIFSKLRI